MRTTPRSTRRTASAQLSADKENLANPSPRDGATAGNRKVRHRLSTAELARLEDVFRQETHPSRQQKKDLAAELRMDYKTVTIWFQNKRQTSKRGQRPVERLVKRSARTTPSDSCLRSVSSPSHNTTLDVFDGDQRVNALESQGSDEGLNTIASKVIVKIKPLLDSLNALTSMPKAHSGTAEAKDEAQSTNPHLPQSLLQTATVSTGSNTHDQTAEKETTKGKSVTKRTRTLEWACERQSKRRKLSREGFVRLGSEEIQGDDHPNDMRMDSALSLLSLASSTQVGPSKDVMRGASLLLGFKHSWRRT